MKETEREDRNKCSQRGMGSMDGMDECEVGNSAEEYETIASLESQESLEPVGV